MPSLSFSGPLAVDSLFDGELFTYVAFVLEVAAYAPEYYGRGVSSGRRLFVRLGALHVIEALSRAVISIVPFFFGAGIFGPAVALAPLVERVSLSLVVGTPAALVSQSLLYLYARRLQP